MPPESEHREPTADAGRYELILEVGTGGMGKVFLARARSMGGFERVVAIKRCHEHLKSDAEFLDKFLDEARIAAQIHHPNVVPTLDVGVSDAPFLVMEYVEGETLARLLHATRAADVPVPVDVAVRVALDILAGLHAAHELRDVHGSPLSVVHRDVTPQNVIVGIDGVARVLDFGIATAASRAVTTKEGHVKGKFGYMPPEQLGGEAASRATDVYAAAVVTWEMLAGARLFEGATDAETLALVLRGNIPSLRAGRGDVPEALEAVLLRALSREPEQRFPTALAFAEALEAMPARAASPRSVGAFVEAHAGPALRARREALRAKSAAGGVPAPGARTTPSSSAAQATRSSAPPPKMSGRAFLALLFAGLMLVLGGLWLVVQAFAAPRPEPADAAPATPVPAAPPPAAAPPAPAAPEAGVADAGVFERAPRTTGDASTEAEAVPRRRAPTQPDRPASPRGTPKSRTPEAKPPAGAWWPETP